VAGRTTWNSIRTLPLVQNRCNGNAEDDKVVFHQGQSLLAVLQTTLTIKAAHDVPAMSSSETTLQSVDHIPKQQCRNSSMHRQLAAITYLVDSASLSVSAYIR